MLNEVSEGADVFLKAPEKTGFTKEGKLLCIQTLYSWICYEAAYVMDCL
jgi:hypothetical protein